MFKGVYTALITPFQGDKIDQDAFINLIERQIAAGVDGIVPTGTTGETPTLSYEEQIQVIQLAVKTANGRCKVIAGTGSNSTSKTVELTRKAHEMGVDGALVVAPYYNRPSQEGIYRHFKTVAESAPQLPIMLYSVPSRCGVEIGAQTVGRLAENCFNIVAIKEAGGSAERVSQIRQYLTTHNQISSFTILSGDDPLSLPMLGVGAVGVVSVASNIIPQVIVALVQSYLQGRFEEALRLHEKYFEFFKALFIEPNPVPLKVAMEAVGMIASSEVRLPLCEMTEQNHKAILSLVAELGIKQSL